MLSLPSIANNSSKPPRRTLIALDFSFCSKVRFVAFSFTGSYYSGNYETLKPLLPTGLSSGNYEIAKLLERPMGFSSNEFGLAAVSGRSSYAGWFKGMIGSSSFTSFGSYFFFFGMGLRAGGFTGGAPSSGNSLHLNLLPPPMGISSILLVGRCSPMTLSPRLLDSRLDSASASPAGSVGSDSISNRLFILNMMVVRLTAYVYRSSSLASGIFLNEEINGPSTIPIRANGNNGWLQQPI
jgi:hypothetical protein